VTCGIRKTLVAKIQELLADERNPIELLKAEGISAKEIYIRTGLVADIFMEANRFSDRQDEPMRLSEEDNLPALPSVRKYLPCTKIDS
jgi:hypothetical protein